MGLWFFVGMIAGAIVWAQLFNIARFLGLVVGGVIGFGIGIGLWLRKKVSEVSETEVIVITPFLVMGFVLEAVSVLILGNMIWFYASAVLS